MSFLLFFFAYVVCAAALLFLALFGSMPVFAGTPVAAAHDFVTGGWFQTLLCAQQLVKCCAVAAAAIVQVGRSACITDTLHRALLPSATFSFSACLGHDQCNE